MDTLTTDTLAASAAASESRTGTPPTPSRDAQLCAYNSVFVELELGFSWDQQMFDWLCGIECERTRIARYIEEYHAHLLTAYDADFLSQLILDKKNAHLEARAMGVN
ncbi:hypothetical protein L602_002200000530 [Cupriavidus gilardii J11]|uniref:Uncharacterized protein n=1 Tax=Cupriavidus gilardii J11 TaxID=936133 RepID=A0A562BL78_9BURK|nr:LysR family transcriptional regulator [Cupriavidus gilardii]TWG85998.1 hypothetical protein L602_002200000530 [Cupriavidus gilardii J11]